MSTHKACSNETAGLEEKKEAARPEAERRGHRFKRSVEITARRRTNISNNHPPNRQDEIKDVYQKRTSIECPFHKRERETGLEPAAPTLARSCSTN